MSGPTYTSPSANIAEMNRIHFELEYTEGISQRMRIPETLKVAEESQTGPIPLQQPLPTHTALMQVPERIVVAGEDNSMVKLCMIGGCRARGGVWWLHYHENLPVLNFCTIVQK